MKLSDITAAAVTIILAVFFLYSPTRELYEKAYTAMPLVITFIKFALLATSGELLVLRIRKRVYWEKTFGLLPKMIIWGLLGLFIYAAFAIFSHGVPALFPRIENKIAIAFLISLFMNVIFAPLMMLIHHLTDLQIQRESGRFHIRTFSPLMLLKEADWDKMWSFVFKKTIPFFWIPAHTITFLLPYQYRTLFAALLSVFLGLLLAINGSKKTTVQTDKIK